MLETDITERGYINIGWEKYEGQMGTDVALMKKIINDGNWDNSDVQSDYFDVGWYTDLKVGSWNKTFEVSK